MDPRALEDFSDHVAALARANGVELTQAIMDHVMAQSMSRGFTPSATTAVFDELTDDYDEPPQTDRFGEISDDDEWEDEDPDTREDPVRDVISEFAEANAERAAESIGRPLSRREQDAIWRATAESADADRLDPETIVAASGVKPWDQMTPGEVNAAMTERARDLEEPVDLVIEVDEDGRPASDRDWNRYMTARAQGVEFEDAEEEWE